MDKTLVQEGLQSINMDEYFETLKQLALKKFSEKKSKDDYWSIRRRLSAFLASKGYESDLIQEVVSDVIKQA